MTSMDRWKLAQLLAESNRVRHLMLLTATPHDGYTDSFVSLLRMLDVDAVEGPSHAPHIIRPVAQRYVCQRRRADVESWFQDDPDRSPFPRRDQDEVIVPPTAYEVDAIRAVEGYGERVLEQAAAGPAQFRTLAHWTVLHFHKRALSSPEALRCSLRNRRKRLKRKLQEATVQSEEAPISPDVARANVLDEDTGERLTDEEAGQRTERLVYGSPEQIRAELRHLEDVLDKAEKVTPSRDNKLQRLLNVVLKDRLRLDPKVVIFTRYVDTMEYLEEQIRGDAQYSNAEVLTILPLPKRAQLSRERAGVRVRAKTPSARRRWSGSRATVSTDRPTSACQRSSGGWRRRPARSARRSRSRPSSSAG